MSQTRALLSHLSHLTVPALTPAVLPPVTRRCCSGIRGVLSSFSRTQEISRMFWSRLGVKGKRFDSWFFICFLFLSCKELVFLSSDTYRSLDCVC